MSLEIETPFFPYIFCYCLTICFKLLPADLVYLQTNSRSSEHLEMKASTFYATFKQLDSLKYDSNMICLSPKKQQIS